MEGWKKVAIGASVVATAGYLLSLRRAKAEIETIATGKIHKVDLNGNLTIRVDVQVKNPTKTALKIKFPFIKVYYLKEDKTRTLMGTSQSVNQDIDLPAFGEAKIEMVMITITGGGFLATGSEIINALLTGKPIKAIVKTISTIDLGWKKLPYEKEDEMVLKR